ncbi:MAG: hypothetical protein JJT88_17230 [Gammaproteobacteria bacterium]|nr:hypothetical protein [Gammaproteobacteria bacterium]
MAQRSTNGLWMLALAACALFTWHAQPAIANSGTTSSSDAEISVLVGGRVWLTRLSDIDLGTYGGSGDVRGNTRMCVHRNDTGIYSITATSANASGGVFQAAGDGAVMRYNVAFQDASGNRFENVRSGQRLQELRGQRFALLCLFQYNARLEVQFEAEDLQAAPPGTYQDVITLLVEPG